MTFCEDCGVELEFDDHVDRDNDGVDDARLFLCPECGRAKYVGYTQAEKEQFAQQDADRLSTRIREAQHLIRSYVASAIPLPALRLIDAVATAASTLDNVQVYLVGGVVRDALFNYFHNASNTSDDVDLVVSGMTSEAFANYLVEKIGGQVILFNDFGTVRWTFNREVAATIQMPFESIPRYIDIATVRIEQYPQQGLLPQVTVDPDASIESDLYRRDFTMNAVAVEISAYKWTVIDPWGGVRDIAAKVIRELHSESFADDPTRILRYARFLRRFKMNRGQETISAIVHGIQFMDKVTGERLRNEFDKILAMESCWMSINSLSVLKVLSAVCPDWVLDEQVMDGLDVTNTDSYRQIADIDFTRSRWLILTSSLSGRQIESLGKRLLMAPRLIRQMVTVREMITGGVYESLTRTNMAPSQVFVILDKYDRDVVAAFAATQHVARMVWTRIMHYLNVTSQLEMSINGNDALTLGLRGPQVGSALQHVRLALVDGQFNNDRTRQLQLLETFASNLTATEEGK